MKCGVLPCIFKKFYFYPPNHPSSMQITPFRATYANFQHLASPDEFCESVKFHFQEQVKTGLLEKYPSAAFYIYQIENRQHRRHIGLIALDAVADYLAGRVKMHERTLREKEEQQIELFLRWNAILKPVLLTYPPVPVLDAWLNDFVAHHKPLFIARFTKSGQVHRVWAVTAPADITHVQAMFAEHIPSAYIADGHHRTTTVALLNERYKGQETFDFEHLFCAFFSTDQLDILDYNRVVEAPDNVSALQLLARLSRLFDVEPLTEARKPEQKHELSLYIRKEWFCLRWRKEILDAQQPDAVALDVSLLNELVLHDLLGITDVRTDSRIAYVEGSKGVKGVEKAVKNGRNRLGFVLYPVSFADLQQLTDAGLSMPPKSTYFEPRMRSGVLIKSLLKEIEK